jgi:hypothetical protein
LRRGRRAKTSCSRPACGARPRVARSEMRGCGGIIAKRMPSPPDSPALDYAPPPSARRRVLLRSMRLWPIWLLLLSLGLAIRYGPPAYRHYRLHRLQEACMSAALPEDRPVIEFDPDAAHALASAHPGEYHVSRFGTAVRVDPRWTALATAMGVPPWPGWRRDFPYPTECCHERYTPSGHRRLVVADGLYRVTVIEPANGLSGRPRVLWRGEVTADRATYDAIDSARHLYGPHRTYGALPDPADRTRLTLQLLYNGVPGTWEYRLGDDDRVRVRLINPFGFFARAMALYGAGASSPTGPSPDGLP